MVRAVERNEKSHPLAGRSQEMKRADKGPGSRFVRQMGQARVLRIRAAPLGRSR
jgi:hypothetical protein